VIGDRHVADRRLDLPAGAVADVGRQGAAPQLYRGDLVGAGQAGRGGGRGERGEVPVDLLRSSAT
jgi:hypothetical protein